MSKEDESEDNIEELPVTREDDPDDETAELSVAGEDDPIFKKEQQVSGGSRRWVVGSTLSLTSCVGGGFAGGFFGGSFFFGVGGLIGGAIGAAIGFGIWFFGALIARKVIRRKTNNTVDNTIKKSPTRTQTEEKDDMGKKNDSHLSVTPNTNQESIVTGPNQNKEGGMLQRERSDSELSVTPDEMTEMMNAKLDPEIDDEHPLYQGLEDDLSGDNNRETQEQPDEKKSNIQNENNSQGNWERKKSGDKNLSIPGTSFTLYPKKSTSMDSKNEGTNNMGKGLNPKQ